jgi:hypothetical protein
MEESELRPARDGGSELGRASCGLAAMAARASASIQIDTASRCGRTQEGAGLLRFASFERN